MSPGNTAFSPLVRFLSGASFRRLLRAAESLEFLVPFDGRRILVFLFFLQHVPDDRRHPPHGRHAGDLRAAAAFDPLVPVALVRIASQHLEHRLPQQIAYDLASLFGDGAQPLRGLAGVAATGGQAEIVGQAAGPWESLDVADPRGNRQRADRRPVPASTASNTACSSAAARSGDLFVDGLQLFLPERPLLKQKIHFQTVQFTQRQFCQPTTHLLRLELLRGTVLLQVVLAQDLVDRIQGRRAAFRQHGTKGRDLPVLRLARRRRPNPPHFGQMFAIEKPLAVDPQ